MSGEGKWSDHRQGVSLDCQEGGCHRVVGVFLGKMNMEYVLWRLSKADAYLCC